MDADKPFLNKKQGFDKRDVSTKKNNECRLLTMRNPMQFQETDFFFVTFPTTATREKFLNELKPVLTEYF